MTEAQWQAWLTEELKRIGLAHTMQVPGVARRLFAEVEGIRKAAFQDAYEEGYKNGHEDGFEVGASAALDRIDRW